MRRIVAMTGAFGAVMAFFGSLVAVLSGGGGTLPGAADGDTQLARGVGAAGMSVLGLAGALVVGARLRTGAVLMAASAVGGLLLVFSFYIVGAVLLAAAVAMVLRPDSDEA